MNFGFFNTDNAVVVASNNRSENYELRNSRTQRFKRQVIGIGSLKRYLMAFMLNKQRGTGVVHDIAHESLQLIQPRFCPSMI